MPTDPLFARHASRLAQAIREQPATFEQEKMAFIKALGERTLSGQGKAHGISPADLPGLTQVGVQVGQAILATQQHVLTYIENLAASETPAVRCCAAMALGEFGTRYPQQIVSLAYKLAKDSAWEVREFIANAFDERMGETQGGFVYELMQQWIHDPDENVRRVSTNALMRYGRRFPDKVLALMKELRADSSLYVRKNVCFCLGVVALERHPQLGYPNAQNPRRVLSLLQGWVEEQDEGTRWIVAETLGRAWSKSGPTETLQLLHKLASDERKSVRSAVGASLKAICKRDAAMKEQVRAWLEDPTLAVRELAQKAL